MSQTVKITHYIGKDKQNRDLFIIAVPEQEKYDGNPSEEFITVAHDYVMFTGPCNFQTENDVKLPESQNRGASNWVSSRASLQISIRDMFDVVLPFLQKHKYLQPEHFEDRIYKGDTSFAYVYHGSIIKYYEDGKKMVAYRHSGSKDYSYMEAEEFDKIKSTLILGVPESRKESFKKYLDKENE